ncbi:hypothetical protein [Streptomyces sp. Ac-502]|uniref:hypothetical protein n=1 Tax=Streptomyces sp. Ac-502 TaxID=3342801 RepID=UPI00386237F0
MGRTETFGILLSVASAAAILWYISAVRAGFRDRVPSIPAGTVCFFLSLDVSLMVGSYDPWFSFLPMWALGAAFVVPDLLFIYQIAVYGPEHFPRIRPTTFRWMFFTALAIGAGAAPVFSRSLDDTHGFYATTLALLIVSVCYPLMLYNRGTRKGQSPTTAGLWLLICTTGPIAFLTAPAQFSVQHPWLIGYMAAVSAAFSATYWGALLRMRANAKTASQSVRTSVGA